MDASPRVTAVASDSTNNAAANSPSSTMKIAEDLFALQDRAGQLFAGLKDLPEFGSQWEAHYAKAFEVYTKVLHVASSLASTRNLVFWGAVI